jgi:hypothetical protein
MKKITRQSFITRRSFLKYSSIGIGSLIFSPHLELINSLPDFPQAERLGRICTGMEGAHFDLRSEPNSESDLTGAQVYRDDVIICHKEVVGNKLNLNVINQRWIETEHGYIYADNIQPVKNLPNTPVDSFPTEGGISGAWVEVTVPYVDFKLDTYPAKSPWLLDTLKPRLYYSQIMWADQMKTDDQGQVYYRLSEKYGYGDVFWAPAEAFKLLTEEDVQPIHPDAEDKSIYVDLNYQVLSCYEGTEEVYFCRISSGRGYDDEGNLNDKMETPTGTFPIWRKMVSTHMSAGSTAAGYDTPGIGWSSLFSVDGAAIHSTFWHNGFGVARSHGCINTAPDDAKWIFKWTVPQVGYAVGDITVSGMNSSTRLQIVKS